MSQLLSEKKFYLIHKPTGKFVWLDYNEWFLEAYVGRLLSSFDPVILYAAKNVLETDLSSPVAWYDEVDGKSVEIWNEIDEKGRPSFDDFEVKELYVTYDTENPDIMGFRVGDKVFKKSKKPFKSGEQIATIKGFQINPHCPKGRLGATFEEDDSIVNLKTLRTK